MSIQAVSWAIEATDLPPVERMVLVAFAYHAHPDGSESRPSIAKVCKETGAHRSTVIRAKQKLVDEGYLVETGTHIRGTIVYRLPIGSTSRTARPVAESDQSDSTSRTARPSLVAQRDLTSRTARPEPSLTVIEPSLSRGDNDDLVEIVRKTMVVLEQAKHYNVWVDQMAVENAICAFPDCDPVKAARHAITFAADPAKKGTGNGARMLWRALEFQQEDEQKKRGVRNSKEGKHLVDSRSQWERFNEGKTARS